MEKQSYETYEFLATTPTDPESDGNQFFVIQDDGTILRQKEDYLLHTYQVTNKNVVKLTVPGHGAVNKEIQYLTQVEDVTDTESVMEDGNATEECAAVFDVSSQQYYVDVGGNASEILSINEQFAITNGENNLYSNDYIIQPEASSASQQIEAEPIIDPQTLDSHQLQLLNGEQFNCAKQSNSLTEITLSDEQYRVLENKGWLLLEFNDKIFVLNTLGLHDITANDELIQKLKNELQNDPVAQSSLGQLKIESVTSELAIESVEETAQTQSDVVELFIEKNVLMPHDDAVENIQYVGDGDGDKELNEQEKFSDTKSFAEVEISPSVKLLSYSGKVSDTQKRHDSIKIKTKYTFTDIPDRIFLGKTVKGKNLYAKVKKIKKGLKNKDNENKSEEITYGKRIDETHDCSSLDGARFTNIIQDSFRDVSKLSPLSISYAGAIFSQLVRLSPLRDSSLQGCNLVVTKMTSCETEHGKVFGKPTMVTGTVKVVDGEETFIHVPLLLHQLLDESEDKPIAKNNSISESPEEKIAKGVIELFHIHVSETKCIDKPPETSIYFSKRKLPLDVLNDAKKRHPNPVYACASCGAVFKSEYLLKDHQNEQCIEVDDELTIDTEEFNTDKEILYSTIENGNEKSYSCTLCETKFTRLFNCQKHIKAHRKGIEKKLKAYKCKMCPKTYFHTSSLSKHIVKEHIQMQSN